MRGQELSDVADDAAAPDEACDRCGEVVYRRIGRLDRLC